MGVTLTELQRIPTSGARAAEVFAVDGMRLLAIPQLAVDVPGQLAGMNAGDSDTDLLLLRRDGGRYVPFSSLPAPGGEDAEFFTVGQRAFLAVASIRSGSGPYRYTVDSRIFQWLDGSFVPFQSFTTHAAKQWRHWRIGDRHFLGLAQGLELPHIEGPNRDSVIYEWDGSCFVEFQHIPSRWAYNWHSFRIDRASFVAHADHLGPSVLYRWNGERFTDHQTLVDRAGRAFATFDRAGEHYLLVAGLAEPVRLMQWQKGRFEIIQELAGLGARELRVVRHRHRLFVVRVNFILGTPADPRPELTSQIYEWRDDALQLAAEFPTSGGTDVAVVSDGEDLQIVVTNSLSPDVRFASETVLYAFSATDETE